MLTTINLKQRKQASSGIFTDFLCSFMWHTYICLNVDNTVNCEYTRFNHSLKQVIVSDKLFVLINFHVVNREWKPKMFVYMNGICA